MNDIDIKKQQREQFLKGANTKDKGLGGHALDAGLSLLSGAVSVPEAVVGLADIPTGGRVGKFLENEGGALGFRPKEAKEAIAGAKTERSRQQLQDFQEAEGFGAKFGQALENKSLITNTVLESLPAMGAGGVVGRGLGAVAPRIGGVAAGALGEGAVGAGLQAESIRQQTDDGLLTAKQSGLAAATGATTAGFGYAGGRLAKELGIGDVDTMFATGSRAAGTRAAAEGAESAGKQKSMVRRALEGALTEGLLEELPQSVSETVLQNIALNRPLEEGVDEAAVLGILSGGVMGAGAGAATRGRAPSANDNAGTDDAQLVATEDMGQEAANYGAPKSNVAGLLGGPLSSAPQLGFSGTPADQYNVGPDGDVFTADQYNDYLAGQRYQDAAARDTGMKGFNDVSQTPEGYEQFGSDPQLPPPRSDYEVRPDGTVLSPEDFNADLQAQREQDAARLAARVRGEITDNTQVPQEATGYGDLTPSQQMGLDPNKGSLSAAAALAVDSGASQRMMAEQQAQAAVEQSMMTQASTQAEPMQNTRMAGLVEVENQEQPTGSKWLQGMRSSLANADPNDANYQTVAAAIEADPKSVPERARLKKQVESLAKRPEPTVKTVNPKARVLDEAKAKSVAYNPRGDEIPTQFDVVDASELVSSHSNNFVENPNYPQQYQPRDRAKAGYQAQVLEIFNKFKPNLLGDDNSVNAGSPIVGPNDNLVESGNGRTIAIRKIYEAGKGDAYRQFVNEQAEKFGLDTNAINNMQQPVLVRRNMSGMDRETFALRANDPVGSEMSSGERAQSDAKNLPNTDLLELDSSGSLNIKGSIKFTQQFIKSMSTAEVNNLVMEDGQLSKTGQNRVSGALLHSAYNSPKLTSAVTEDMDATAKNTLKALVDKAPQIAKINQAVKEGKREPTTLAEDIKTAAETYINLVETEANIDDYLNMDDMFGDGISQQAKEIVRDFYNNPRSTVRMGAALQARIDEANRSNAPDLLADFEADAPNVLSNDPAPTNAQTATQLTDENPTVNIPAPKKAPRELSDKAMVREMQKPTTKNTETDYRAALNLSEGQNLGRLIMSSGRVFDDAVVKSMDDKGVTVEATVNGKRGLHKGMQYQTVDAGINNTKSYAKQQAAKDKPPQAPVTKPETAPALRQLDATGRAKDGKSIKAGEQFQTVTNRETTPYPKQKSERYASQWLIDNAVAEAEARGNKFAARQFANTDIQKGGYLLQADQEGIHQYLFDESSTDADVKVTSLKDMAEANEQKTIAPKPSEPKFSRAAGLSETAELKDLIVAHNLRSEGVLAAAELGGLAAPSIAVVRAEISDFTSYGEITLLADPLLLSGKSMPTFDADIYSPRQPRASYNVNTKKFRDFEKTLSEAESFGLEVPNLNSLEYTSGFDSFKESAAVRYEYLKSINKLPKIKNEKVSTLVKRAAALGVSNYNLRDDKKVISMATSEAKAELRDYSERVLKGKSYDEGTQNQQEDIAFFKSYLFNDDGSVNDEKIRAFVGKVSDYRRTGGVDQYSFRRDISEAVHSEKHRRGYDKWSKDKFETFLDGKRLDMGEDRNGNTKYKPYNLDNVVREMTRNLRNGEGYFYGSGSIRSQYANELKGIEDMQKSRNKIISKEAWDNKVKEIDIAFDQFLEAMQPFYKGEIDYEYQSKASEAMAQGNHAIAKEFNLTSESRKLINGIQQYLANQPTEYFEAKAQRAVQFHEFDTAVVPKNADPEAVKVLRDAGVKIRRYDQNVEGDKNRIIAQQTKLMFSKPENERANPSAGEKVKGSTNTTRQQVLAKLNDKFGKETIDKLMAAGKLDIKTLNDYVVDGELTIPSDVDGLYHNGKATLIADNLSDDMIIPTFLHELGGHGGMQTLMDKKAYDALMKDFDAMVKAGDPLAMQAKAMADKVARNKQDALDEYLPYLITLASRKQSKQGKLAGMINRMVMAIRSWLKNTLGVPIAINSQDILSLAERMVNEIEKQGSLDNVANAAPQFSDPNIPDKQLQDVRDQYENTDEWMKAPNGKDTNLNEQQWLNVRTSNFKNWFGDWEGDPANSSQAVDENGEPLVLYRGDKDLWNEYDTSRQGENTNDGGVYGVGAYLSPSKKEARDYGSNVREFFANTRRTADFKDFQKNVQSSDIAGKLLMSELHPTMKFPKNYSYKDYRTDFKALSDKARKNSKVGISEANVIAANQLARKYKSKGANNPILQSTYNPMQFGSQYLTDVMRGLGYDSSRGKSTGAYGADEYVVFDSNQIKSTDNTTFDNSNPDIRFSNPNVPDKHMQDVRDQYENTDQWLKAPNGNDTNLTEQQWLQVRTPAFKQWFGDWENDPKNASKIVDDNGEPMVVYHGTQSDPFHTFDPNRLASNTGNEGWYGSGHYFTPDEYTASEYGDTEIPVFLNIRNPMLEDGESIGQYAKKVGHKVDIDILDFNYIADLVVEINPLLKDMVDKKISKNKDISEKDTYDKYISNGGLPNSHYGQMMSDHLSDSNDTLSYGVAETIMSGDYINNDYLRLLERLSGKAIPDDKYQEVVHDDMTIPDLTKHGKKAKEATKAFKDDGYDGVWAEYTEEIVAFNPNQIKSAINNAGTFNSSNPDIRFSNPNVPAKQLDDVRAKYEGTDEWMKAPNGSDTNLTERQWLQVRTPAFKQWFGDWENDPDNASKVVDGNGEPMVAYHGTQNEFTEFDIDRLGEATDNTGAYGQGFYFTPDFDDAKSYSGSIGTVGEYFLNIRNILQNNSSEMEQFAEAFDVEKQSVSVDEKKLRSLFLSQYPEMKEFIDFNYSNDGNTPDSIIDNYQENGGELDLDELGVFIYMNKRGKLSNDNVAELEDYYSVSIPDDAKNMQWTDWLSIAGITADGYVTEEITDAIKDAGYDGVSSFNMDGSRTDINSENEGWELLVFNPNQIKSATGNVGTFDPSNNDIRFSRAAGMSDPLDPVSIAKQAGQRFQDWATSKPAGKVSWWHNTVGTMYNLAERNPLFKPVYEHTEKFINDVSFYAAKASEMAPRLLPKLDSWRDLSKTAVSAKDNEAISKPIFEGTLIWGRDLNGKAVLIDDWRKKVMATSKQDRLNMLRNANRITPAQEADLAKLNAVQANRFINGIIDDEVSAGLVWTDSELRSKFNLSDEHIELYREFRATTDNSLDSMTRSDMLRKLGKNSTAIEKEVMEAGTLREAVYIIEQHANSIAAADPSKSTAMSKVVTDVKASAYRSTKLMDDGYAPLSRFGKFTVDVVDAAGEREYFGLFESAYEARKMAEEMRALYGDDAVTQGALSEQEFKLFAGVTPETAELFGEMLGLDATGDKDSDDAFQEYLRRTKNNRSTMKRLMHRKGIKGYSEDVGRVLASFVYSNARHTSAALNMGNLDRSISDIPKAEGQLKDVAIRLAQYIKNPQEEGHVIRGFMFAQYLGGSVASAAVNLTQPIAVSFPYLSQFGGAAKAAAEIGRAAKDWASGSNFNAELTREISRAEADGTLSPQEVHNLLRMARGQNPLAAGDGTKYGNTKAMAQNAASRVGVAWGALFSLAEQANRRVTFVAAYRMAKDQGMADPAEFARKSIKETQFVYNKASRMRWGRGAVGGTVMTFKTYSVSYIELMHRLWNQGEKGSVERKEGRKAAMLMVATIFLLSGTGGLPFMEDAEDVIDGFGQMIGYNMNTRKARDEFLDEIFGEMAGDFLESGISSIHGMPTDISSRLGMDNLIPATGIFKERTNNTRDVMELAGPAGDFIGRTLSGARTAVQGAAAGDARQVGRGALETMPVAVRNAFKGADMLGSGIYKDTKGYKVVDTSPLDAAVKAIGFQPKNVSKAQNANYLAQSELAFYTLRAAQIRALWAQGVSEKNKGKVDDARAALANWNSRNPDQPITIRPTDIARRVREMNMTKDQRTAKRAPTALRSKIADQLQDAND